MRPNDISTGSVLVYDDCWRDPWRSEETLAYVFAVTGTRANIEHTTFRQKVLGNSSEIILQQCELMLKLLVNIRYQSKSTASDCHRDADSTHCD